MRFDRQCWPKRDFSQILAHAKALGNCTALIGFSGMGNGHGFSGDEIKEESSWRYPLGIFMATLVLCAIFLYYYVGPSVEGIQRQCAEPGDH